MRTDRKRGDCGDCGDFFLPYADANHCSCKEMAGTSLRSLPSLRTPDRGRRALTTESLLAFEDLKRPAPAQPALFPLAPSIRPSYPSASASLAPDAGHHSAQSGAGAQRTTQTARAAHRLRRTPSAPDTRVAPPSERTAGPIDDPRHHIATREAPPLCAEGPRAHEEPSTWT